MQFFICCRLFMGLVFAVVVWWTHYIILPDGTYPMYLYLTIIFVYALHQVSDMSINCILFLQNTYQITTYMSKYIILFNVIWEIIVISPTFYLKRPLLSHSSAVITLAGPYTGSTDGYQADTTNRNYLKPPTCAQSPPNVALC